jgi:hypothetical protein
MLVTERRSMRGNVLVIVAHTFVALGITNDVKCGSNAGYDNGGKVRESHRLPQREHLLLFAQCGNRKGESANHRRRANLLAIPKQRTSYAM